MFWAANGGDFIENKTIEKSASADREYRFFFLKRRNEKTGQGYCPVFLLCLRYKIKRSYNVNCNLLKFCSVKPKKIGKYCLKFISKNHFFHPTDFSFFGESSLNIWLALFSFLLSGHFYLHHYAFGLKKPEIFFAKEVSNLQSFQFSLLGILRG